MASMSDQTVVVPPSIASVFPDQHSDRPKEARIVTAAQKRSLWNSEQTSPAHQPGKLLQIYRLVNRICYEI